MVPNESTCLYYLQQNSQARHKYWVLHTHLKQIPRCPNREWNFIKICRKKMTVGMWIDRIQPMLYGSFTSQKVNALIQLIYIQRDLGDFLLSNDSWYCIFLFFHRHGEKMCHSFWSKVFSRTITSMDVRSSSKAILGLHNFLWHAVITLSSVTFYCSYISKCTRTLS